jgi:hypothetical protein
MVLGLAGAVVCFSFLAAAALPYPDPTPALLAAQEGATQRWGAGVVLGVAVAALGTWDLWRARKRRRA